MLSFLHRGCWGDTVSFAVSGIGGGGVGLVCVQASDASAWFTGPEQDSSAIWQLHPSGKLGAILSIGKPKPAVPLPYHDPFSLHTYSANCSVPAPPPALQRITSCLPVKSRPASVWPTRNLSAVWWLNHTFSREVWTLSKCVLPWVISLSPRVLRRVSLYS